MELKKFKLKLDTSNGINVYSVEGYKVKIFETKTMNGEFYKLSTKEILNVLDYFKVLKGLRQIKIHNTKLLNVQAMVVLNEKDKKYDIMNLYAVSELTKGRYGIRNDRKNTLFTLLHEIGHLKNGAGEEMADQFAIDHIDELWGKMIKE
jgi:hypothetical protein